MGARLRSRPRAGLRAAAGAALRGLELEDLLVALTALVLVPAWSWAAARPWAGLLPGPQLRALLGLVCLVGLWSAAARPLPAAEGDTPGWRLVRHGALLSMLLAFPALGAALSDGDTGFGAVLAGLGLAGWVPAVLWARLRARRGTRAPSPDGSVSGAPGRSAAAFRARLLPLTVFNTWCATELLVDRFLLAPGDVRAAAAAAEAGVQRFATLVLAQLVAASIFLLVPYALLVVPPRLAAGERVGLGVWARRYCALLGGVLVVFTVQALRDVDAARAEARHRFDGLAAARARPLDVIALDLHTEDLEALDLSPFPYLAELATPAGWDRPLDAVAAAPGLVRLVLSPARVAAVPEAVCALSRLEVLDVEGNRLEALPDCLGALPALRALHLGGNRLTDVPPAVARLESLTVLELHDNPLSAASLEALLSALATGGWPKLERLTLPWPGGPLDQKLQAVARSRGIVYRSGPDARR